MGGSCMQDKSIYKRILVNFLVTLVAIVLCVIFLGDVLRFFLPFVIGFFIAAIANPMVRFLEKKILAIRVATVHYIAGTTFI